MAVDCIGAVCFWRFDAKRCALVHYRREAWPQAGSSNLCYWLKAGLIYGRLGARDLDRRQGAGLNRDEFDNIGFAGFWEGRVARPCGASSVPDRPS